MNVTLVGAGAWGKNHLKTLHELECLGAVVEPNDELRFDVERDYPDVPTFSSIEALLQPSEPPSFQSSGNAAIVATPAQTHVELAVRLLEAGLHVLVEKPMALSSTDCRRIVDAAEENDRRLMVGHLLLFQPAIGFIKEFLDEGRLGRLHTLTQRRSKLGRARRVENALWSFGVHDVAVLLHLVGRSPVRVHYTGHASVTAGVADDTHLHLEFGERDPEGEAPDPPVASLHNSWLWPRVERELIVTGEKGILVYDELNHRVTLHRKGIDAETLANVDEGEEILFEGGEPPLRLELQHFLDCCENGATPIADGRQGVEVVRVLEEAG